MSINKSVPGKPVPGKSALAHCSCAMLRRAARQVTQDYDLALRPAGLKLTQYSVLANVERTPGLTITQLAARIMLDRTTLTRNLRPMLKAGWVRLEAGPDKRAQAVYLTAAGRKAIARARPLWQRAEREFRGRMGEERLAALNGLLNVAMAGE